MALPFENVEFLHPTMDKKPRSLLKKNWIYVPVLYVHLDSTLNPSPHKHSSTQPHFLQRKRRSFVRYPLHVFLQ